MKVYLYPSGLVMGRSRNAILSECFTRKWEFVKETHLSSIARLFLRVRYFFKMVKLVSGTGIWKQKKIIIKTRMLEFVQETHLTLARLSLRARF